MQRRHLTPSRLGVLALVVGALAAASAGLPSLSVALTTAAAALLIVSVLVAGRF